MWTISYEFRCYILTLLLAYSGIFSRRNFILLLTSVFLALYIALPFFEIPTIPTAVAILTGQPALFVRLFSAYLVGTCFKLYKPSLTPHRAWIALALWLPSMLIGVIAQPALMVLGGYILFFVALKFKNATFRNLNAAEDISYGLYLYAFPIGKLLFWYWPTINIWLHAGITAALALGAGWLSWHLVEKPAMRLANRDLSLPSLWRLSRRRRVADLEQP